MMHLFTSKNTKTTSKPVLNSIKKNLLFTGVISFMAASVAHADYQWLDAYQAAKRGNETSLQNYQYSMNGGLFAMYPEYWLLNSGLAYQPVSSVENFTRTYWQTVMGEKLAADFVEAKARAGDYQTVAEMARYVTNADRSEACALAIGKNGTGDDVGALALKHKVWLAADKQPSLCEQLGDELENNRMISQQDKLQRLQVMLRADKRNKAVSLAQQLGLYEVTYEQLDSISASPESYLYNPQLGSTGGNMLYLYAIARQAENFLDGAANQLAQDANRLNATTKQYAYRILGMEAMNHVVKEGFHSQTVAWFDQSVGVPFSAEEAEDYGRVAARFGQWNSVLHAINAMNAEQKKERMWQYWFARASEQLGTRSGSNAATSFYQSLAQKNDYYGLLAKDRLGQTLAYLPTPYQPNQSDYNRLQNDPHFARAFTLRDMNAPSSFAKREWNWAVRQAKLKNDDGMILAAASRAKEIGWYDRAIYAADNTKQQSNYMLAYLTPFQNEVVYYSQQVGLDPAWAYGIMRQESRFQGAARSHVGASGLMQIMPATGRFIARKLGERYSKSKLRNMDTNIRWGTFYLSHILGELQYSPVLATAGYNAGPSRARRWQPDYNSIPADQYVEGIPFNETREYVKHVMTNAVHYALLFNQGAQSISQRMGDIPPRG